MNQSARQKDTLRQTSSSLLVFIAPAYFQLIPNEIRTLERELQDRELELIQAVAEVSSKQIGFTKEVSLGKILDSEYVFQIMRIDQRSSNVYFEQLLGYVEKTKYDASILRKGNIGGRDLDDVPTLIGHLFIR